MSKMIEAEWLGGAQLAALLGVTTMTIWRWERDSKLNFPQPTVIRDRKYWSRDDINAWMRRMATSKANKVAEVA
jgi:predicted DNA-binding transcriptional regulator AlpA